MNDEQSVRRSARIIRWIARIWSIPILIFALLRAFTPDPYATEPVQVEDWFLLGLWGVAILGLLVAWRLFPFLLKRTLGPVLWLLWS